MKTKAFLFVLLNFFIFFVNCGILRSDYDSGSLTISFRDRLFRSNVKTGETKILNRAICLLKKGREVVFFKDMSLMDQSYFVEFGELETGNNYEIYLYGKEGNNDCVDASAYMSDITVNKNESTNVTLSWSSFLPEIISPSDGDTIINITQPLLEWSSVPGAEKYLISIYTKDSYYRCIDSETIRYSNYVPFDFLSNGTYYWQIKCYGFQDSYSSETTKRYQFTIKNDII